MKPIDPTIFQEREQRTVTLFITGKLLVEGGGEGLCRVRNLSVGGLMLETRMPLALGERVAVELRGTGSLSGAVVWAREGRAGIAFHQPVIVEELVRTAPQLGSRLLKVCQPRGPRVTIDCPIEVQLDDERVGARLTDISQGGAKLALPLAVHRDDRMILMIPGLPLKLAIVRWTRDEVGVAFAEPLPFELLSEWLMVRSAGEYRDEGAVELA
jgi:hypothetical protein